MQLNKASFALGNAFGAILIGVIVVACGGDDTASSGTGAQNFKIDGANVLVKRGAQITNLKGGMVRVQASDQLFVLAENVALQTTANDLTSTNLQSALDNEMAVDIPSAIVGVWDIENYLVASDGCVTFPTGKVEIKADGTYEILTGTFGAASDEAQGTVPSGPPLGGGGTFQCNANSARKYKIIGKGAYFTSTGSNSGITYAVSSPVSITEATVNSMTMYGSRGMSRLTRAVQRPISAPATAPAAAKQLVAMSRN